MSHADDQKKYEQSTKYAAQRKYHATHSINITMCLNRKTDADIIALLDPEKPLAAQIKQIIRDAQKKSH